MVLSAFGDRGLSVLAVLIGCFFFCCGNSSAQADDKEPAAILELGGTPGLNVKDGTANFGPTIAVEITPIEKWLELEFGVTPAFGHHSTEWDTDLLFKKPWTLSKKVEFMFGVGPAWVHSREYTVTSNSISAEVVLDFMFWPSRKRRFGWYVEPGYEYNFGAAREQSAGISGGLLIAIR